MHEFSQLIYSIVLQPRVIANLAFSSLCTFMQINSHPSLPYGTSKIESAWPFEISSWPCIACIRKPPFPQFSCQVNSLVLKLKFVDKAAKWLLPLPITTDSGYDSIYELSYESSYELSYESSYESNLKVCESSFEPLNQATNRAMNRAMNRATNRATNRT